MSFSRILVSWYWLHVFPAKGFRRENKSERRGPSSRASQAVRSLCRWSRTRVGPNASHG